ncbi:MAG: TldD/PmbA family protein [Deltaproteobacteria bacterium]|nr:TldD/PmbA family protein [Deltaproteobacteria bacterium]
MIKKIPTEKILKIALSKGADFAEIFAEHTTVTTITDENKRVERANKGVDAGFGLRVISGNKTLYGFTNNAEELFDIAITLSSSALTHVSSKNICASPLLSEVSNKNQTHSKLLKLAKNGSEKAWGMGPNIKQVQVALRHSMRYFCVVNSNGSSVEDEKIDSVAVVLVVAEKDGAVQTGYEPLFGNLESIEKTAETAAQRALTMLTARKSPRGLMPVVISSSAGGTMIHEAVGHGLEADLAGQGMSVYKDKIGLQVASTLITVVDDSTVQEKRGSFHFDDEGSPAKRTVLVENGILKSYMHDLMSAKKMGAKPTGNGRRESYRNRPIVRMTNTFVTPGKTDPSSIISSVPNGILVKKMGGGQVNTINGDFVFDAQEAYLIENGKATQPVRGATLVGNGPKILMEIDMVGNDLGFGIGTCGKEGQGVPVGHGMPTIRIPSITVGGTD